MLFVVEHINFLQMSLTKLLCRMLMIKSIICEDNITTLSYGHYGSKKVNSEIK